MKNSSISYPDRHIGIDACRVFAFACVVILHSFQPLGHDPEAGTVLTQFCRWAVPFFFLTTGYFLGFSKLSTIDGVWKLIRRLAPIMVFWLFVYMVFFGKLYALKRPDVLLSYILTGGPAFHLWFISALGISAAGVYLMRGFGWAGLMAVGIALYLLGLAFGPYRELLSLPEIPWQGTFKTRWGPFLGYILVATGYYLGRTQIKLSMETGLLMALTGLAFQFIEGYSLWFAGKNFVPYDYLAGTALFGFGTFVMALNAGNSKFMQAVAKYGPVTLGAYCIHLFFIQFLAVYFDQADIALGLYLSSIVCVLSLFV
ncbi:MAG: hypothetical protein DI586_05620, partial [Micavibrio aeruginosavorus]